MKIVVSTSDGKSINLPCPNGLLTFLLPSLLKHYGIKLTRKQAGILVNTLRQYRHENPSWKLLEVKSQNGECVEITI